MTTAVHAALVIGLVTALAASAARAWYDARHQIRCGGLVELVVNAMTEAKPGDFGWEWR